MTCQTQHYITHILIHFLFCVLQQPIRKISSLHSRKV